MNGSPDPGSVWTTRLHWPGPRHLVLGVVLFGIYVAMGRLCLMLNPVGGFAALVWTPTAVALVGLLKGGLRLWPAVSAGAFLVNLLQGAPPTVALGIAAGNTLEAVVAVAALRRIPGDHAPLERVRFVVWLVSFAAVGATFLSASIGVGSLLLAGLVRPGQLGWMWRAWWVGDAASALTLAPLFLAWPGVRRERPRSRRRWIEAVTVLAATILIASTVLVRGRPTMLRPYLLFVPLLWAAVRFGPKGVTALTFVGSSFAVWGATRGFQAFPEPSQAASLLTLQTYMAFVAATSLLLASVTAERARAEASRGEGEARLRLAQQVARIGIIEWNLQTGQSHWTPELETMYGLTPDGGFDGSRSAWAQLIHPEDRAATVEAVNRALATGTGTEGEWRVVWPDGSEHWLSGRWQIFRDKAGRPQRMLGVSIDITERKRVEAALRLSSERLETFAAAVFEGVVYTQDGRVLDCNDQFARIAGATVAEMKGTAVADWIAPEDRERVLANILGHHASAFEHVMIRKDGTRVIVEVHGEPSTRGPGGGRLTVVRDVTERKRAEDAVRASESRYRALFNSANDAIFLLDGEVLRDCNRTALEMFAGSREQILGRRAFDLSPERQPDGRSSQDEGRRRVRAALAGSRQFFEWRHVRLDGSEFAAEVSLSRVDVGEGDRSALVLAIVRDITERKRYEEELRTAAQRKDQFIAMLGHELRNPLAPIRNSLSILERVEPGSERAQHATAIIDRQVGHLTRLIEDLLEATRITRGKIELRRERVNLTELARVTVDDYRTVFDENGVELELRSAASALWVNGDRTRLAQVLGNLLQNAVKFTPRGGQVTVTVEPEAPSEQAVIIVTDTGRGIEPDVLPHLFDLFTQADTTLDRRKGGLGLGLALARGLVELHGGTVSGSSPGAGRGATFTVRLPLETRPTHRAPVPPHPLPAEGRQLRILTIEDNVDAAESLCEVLALGGHEVAMAHDGPSGIRRARDFHPDVLLCDIGLPGMDGYEVARTFRADPDLQSTYLIALTGYAQPEDVARARDAGFDRHLAKPPALDSLEQTLAGLRSGDRAQPEQPA